MCGIIGVTGAVQPLDVLLAGLEALEYRGYDSAGIALINADADELYVARCAAQTESVEKLKVATANAPISTHAGIGHTRWATHGAPTEANAHPQLDCTRSVAIVHNGIIENHRELRKVLEVAGHHFASDTDSEVLAHLIEAEIAGGCSLREAVRKGMVLVRGDLAIAVVSLHDPDALVAATCVSSRRWSH